MTKPTWHYNPGSLAASGIYSSNDLENLRDHMFPAEKKNGILNTHSTRRGEPIMPQKEYLFLLDNFFAKNH